MPAHVALDASGYVQGIASMPFGVNGVNSIPLSVPDDFDEEWMNCYRWTGDEWVFDEAKKAAAVITEIMTAVRTERDRRLAACDYVLMPDYPVDDQIKEAWKVYRQALRDVPEQPGFPDNVQWPEKPGTQ